MHPKVVLALCVSFALFSCGKNYTGVHTGHEGQTVPAIDLISPDSSRKIATTNIPAGEPFILFYIRADCPYCHSELQTITNNIAAFKHIRFYILANHSSQRLKRLCQELQLDHYPNIFLGVDYNGTFRDYFSPEGVPYTAFYRKDKTLDKVLMGALTLKQLNAAIQD